MPYGCTSREIVRRQVGYHITVAVVVVVAAVAAMCICTDKTPVASPASVPPVTSASCVESTAVFLFLAG